MEIICSQNMENMLLNNFAEEEINEFTGTGCEYINREFFGFGYDYYMISSC